MLGPRMQTQCCSFCFFCCCHIYCADAKATYAIPVPEGADVVPISYYWESDEFAAEIAKWCEQLRGEGIDVRLDQFEKDVIRQDSLIFWKENLYSQAKYVIVFASPGYATHAMDRQSRLTQEELEGLPNYPCGCDVKTEYSCLLSPGFTNNRLHPVPVLLANIIRAPRSQCLPILLQSPGLYKLPSNEFGLVCRLTGRNPNPRPVVSQQRPQFRPQGMRNPYSRSQLANGFHGQDGKFLS